MCTTRVEGMLMFYGRAIRLGVSQKKGRKKKERRGEGEGKGGESKAKDRHPVSCRDVECVA